MIVLDASVLIAHLEANDAHHGRATELLLGIADEPLGASPLTLAEVLVGPARAGTLATAERAIHELAVATVAMPEDSPTRLAQLHARTHLRMPDCCVLLAAVSSHADIATFDERLAAAAHDLGITARG